MKYVRDTAAGKSIAAWVIIKNGHEIAIVQAHYANGGTVTVNIWQRGEPAQRSARAAIRERRKIATEPYMSPMRFQHGKAGGFGYDKLTAALCGLYIDGHELTDHCSRKGAPKRPRGRSLYPSDYKPPKGYSLANHVSKMITFGFNPERYPNPSYAGEEGYSDCYRACGLKFLEAKGYLVIEAI